MPAGIQQSGAKREIIYNRGEFRLRLGDDSGHTVFFQSVYLGLQKDRKSLAGSASL
jgi:hypothetical protein